MHFSLLSSFVFLHFLNSTTFAFACEAWSDHATNVIKLLNVTLTSEAANYCYITVNGKNYAPQTKGFNVAVFDVLSGRFLTSAAFDCAASQDKCNELGTFLSGLPRDTVVLIAIQESGLDSNRILPIENLQEVGIQNSSSLRSNYSFTFIGYKGQRSPDWKKEQYKGDGQGPAHVSAVIPITCSYVPSVSTTCSPFNVASEKYGGNCMNSSSGECKYAIDGNSTSGWLPSSNEIINSYIKIGFHTSFIVNKFRIKQSAATGQQIRQIFLEFSDCSRLKFTLTANNSDFQEFTFLTRRVKWIKLTIKKLYGSSGGVGIQEIELNNEYCNQKTLCDAVHLQSNKQSSRYRLHRRKFPFMIDSQDKVSVLLVSGSLANSSRYEVIIGSDGDSQSKLKRIKGNLTADVLVENITGPLKKNQLRSFWIEIETDRVVFGSGEKIYLFWRDGDPINVKYLFFSSTKSAAKVHVCGRTDQCYKDATHYWPLDKSAFPQDIIKETIGKFYGPWTTKSAPAKGGFSSLTVSTDSSTYWLDLGDFPESCLNILSKCPHGFSVSIKASISGSGTGHLLSFGRVGIFYVNETVHFSLKDKQRVWEVKGAYKKNTWQTFSMSWSHMNGLTAVIAGNADVLRNFSGKAVTPSSVPQSSFTIGRPKDFQGVIRDVAVWELEISKERMKTLHVCNDPDTCPESWEYFEGSCYKEASSNLSASSAREACVNESADLVKITSEEENAFVSNLIKGEAWIGLKQDLGVGLFQWRDGMKVSYENWKNGSQMADCVVMEASGAWRKTPCSSYASRYVCEHTSYQYLGCYEDSDWSPAFVNPGEYKPSSMTPGLCMQECGTRYFKFAALKRGNLCLCSNSTPTAENASDLCFWPCLGSGNKKCGGDSHISVYKSVTAWPLSLKMSLEPRVYTFKAFNLTLTPKLPANGNQIVESYNIIIGDGTTHYTNKSHVTHVILHPGSYYIQGTAIVKHSKTGHRSTVGSSAMVTAVSNLSSVNISCQVCASVNSSAGCSVKFLYGSDVNVSVQFAEGENPSFSSLPDADAIAVGTPVGEAHSRVISDGLYLMAGQEVASKGEAVAFEMDVATGGSLGIMVYRPKCMQSARYCPALRKCISNFTLWTDSAIKNCDNDTPFSLSEGQCVAQNTTSHQKETIHYGSVDYECIHSYSFYTTSGLKRILIKNKNQRFLLEPGDVFGVRFPNSGPKAALKTSSAGFSLFYSSAVVNKTGAGVLHGHCLPLPVDRPKNFSIVPAIALVQSTESESRLEKVYKTVGHNTISLSVGNSLNVTKTICIQEEIRGLQLNLPEVFPYAESVNLTAAIAQGTNVTYNWDFGDKSNGTSLSPWITNAFDSTGQRTIGVLAGNRIGLVALWCPVVIQERIAGFKFKNDSLEAIENGTTASIGWTLVNGSHVDFNFTITPPNGSVEAKNLTDVKVFGATFFGLYKSNLTVVGRYSIAITATNKVNSETITGNLSVQYAIHGVVVNHTRILKTNETFNFTVLHNQRYERARYTLHTMDGNITTSTDKVIPYTYLKAGRYKVVLIASNDVSSMIVNCTEIVVQDVIEGLMYTSFNHSVAVKEQAEILWRLTQGSELLISIDYGDRDQTIVNRSISVGDIFVAVSKHNYTKPGKYRVVINARNLVDNKTINTTVYVETPAWDPGLAIWRSTLSRAEGRRCNGTLYVPANDSITLNVTISNGTNLNAEINFGDNSSVQTTYFHREFSTFGWTTHHSYFTAGKYNVTVTFFNRNPQNASYTCRVTVQYPVRDVIVTSNSPSSSDSVVILSVSFGYEPSGPLNYHWQYGDNTPYSLKNDRTITHRYPNKCGVYIVAVNVSNEISYGIGTTDIIIQDKIQGLKIITNHTKYDNKCKKLTLPDKTYPVEYDVSFTAFITKGTNVTFTWYFNGSRICMHKTCLRTFNSCGNLTVQLVAQNNVSSVTRNVTITLEESIGDVQLAHDGPTVQDEPVNFTLTVAQNGSDTQFEIYRDNAKEGSPLILTPNDFFCNDKNCTKRFFATYKKAREYSVSIKAQNRVSCVDETITVLVGKGHCKRPVISVPGFESNKKEFKRSEKVVIKTKNKIDCFNVSSEFTWKITTRCESSNQDNLNQQRNLNHNIKKQKINTTLSSLDFPVKFFNYCRELEFEFTINMTSAEGFYSKKKIYVEITKSPLVAIILGGSERTVGSNTEVEIDASRSHDPDYEKPQFESAAWFCDYNNSRLPTKIPSSVTNNSLTNGSCFGYVPGQLTPFNNKTEINLNSSLAKPGYNYTIRFIMEKGGRKSVYKDQTLKVVSGNPPEMSIECIRNCGEKINPAEKFALKGKGKSKNNGKINYKWSVKECSTSDNCQEVDNLKRYSLMPNLESESFVIIKDYFKGDFLYHVTLTGKVNNDGAVGSSTYDVKVNKPPKNRTCNVEPLSGEPLNPVFNIKCDKFEDEDKPLKYTFLYKKSKEDQGTRLGESFDSFLNKFSLPTGNLTLFVKVEDKFGASTDYKIGSVTVYKAQLSTEQVGKKLDETLELIEAGGNINEAAAFLSSVAQVLNENEPKKKSKDLQESRKLREKLVTFVVDNAKVKEDTSLADVAQLSGTLSDATAVPDQNNENVVNKVSSFIVSAGKAIRNQAKDASSGIVKEAADAVFRTAVNVIASPSEQSAVNNTKKAVGTVKTLGAALLTTKVAGEKETIISVGSLAMGVERYNPDNIGNTSISMKGSKVVLPANFTACRQQNGSVNRMSLVTSENLYPGIDGNVTDKLVSLSFTPSKHDGSVEEKSEECNVTALEEEIKVTLPRNNAKDPSEEQGNLRSDKYNVHNFNITDNASAVNIQVAWNISVAVQLFVNKGSRPKPEEGVFDFNATFRLRGAYSVHSTNLSVSKLFLSNDALNWTAAGQYFVMLGFIKNDSLPDEEKDKMNSDGTVPYNFSLYTSKCMFFDEKKEVWSTEGLKVGDGTNLRSTECLTTHLTTFGSSFFVPPNKINFDELNLNDLVDSPHALIFVCVILGLYLVCLIPARRADKNDALKTGVTPLSDNDPRDTYCYEIHIHTGFIRGAGTSAEVSIVLTGGLGDSEPRVLKDPNRKNFKTGSVDPFLLTVPQSLGNLKHIRIWHNNGGSYPSWNLLRVMIQDLQTDQRWWYVCDDWLAVDEGDGKIERILYPASKKELTKFNVLFTSEVRKNLTDGHIWFSVVARPPRSTFTRVQRLTCCLSILMTTLIANAMFYRVGKNETPKNAIRIMGFSFSIRQVSIGIMSSMIVFPANLIIVTIFRKAKPKASQYAVKPQQSEGDDVDIEAGEEKKKVPTKFALPHWFVYIAYAIAFVATCTSASFVITYGMEFGPQKSAQWLSSITISFIQDVLLTQPIKVFIMATLFALLIKDPKKAEQESFTDANALANDEEWLQKNTEDLDAETQQTLKQLINDKPPDEAKLEIARKLRMKERQMESIIREIAWYVIFLFVLLTIAYGNRDLTTSKVTKYMRDTFVKATYSGNITYQKVHEIRHYWEWMRNTFIPSLMPQFYYNNETLYAGGFLADIPTAWLLGRARLRQLRIKKDTCVFKRFFLHFIHECNDFYSVDEENRGSYLPGWNVNSNQNVSTTTDTRPWMYQTGSQLKTYPYWGYKATYSAGGYVQELPMNNSVSLNIIQNLNDTNWLDRYTRAIFSEFAIYNANTNLFCVVTLLFEQLPTGSLTPYPNILTLRLFRFVGGEMYFVVSCEVVYLLFCVYFVFKEIKMLVKKGKEHLKNPWSLLEVLLTSLSLCAVGLYFARLAFTNSALNAMRDSVGESFVSFHYTAFLDEWLKCIIGIIVFFSFLKVFRLLRFNRRMSLLQQVLKRCFTQLISFMVMFALAFLAFALLACLVFGQTMEGFGTFLTSCASLMDTLLGKFTLKKMSQANRIIGPIFFYSYTVSMVFILINMFVTIINDAFTDVRSDVEKQSNDYEIVDFMIHRLKKNIGKTIGNAIHPVYKEPKTDLELKFDKIVDDADNVIHCMRNITFEDFRKTRWFQGENCTEKKKNLMRLLMEVDWDYYEDELCDSIPVFERFLNQNSENELKELLQSYRQKRMVEDLVFDKINGQDGSSESDSDDSSDDSDNASDDQWSNDENGSEIESAAEGDRRLSTSTFSTTSQNSAKRPGSAIRVVSPAILAIDVKDETATDLEQNVVEDRRRKSSFTDHAVSDNELMAILEDVRLDALSRCATDAELDDILYDDTLNPRRCDSNPENTFASKKKKKSKKNGDVPVEEKTIKEAWVSTVLTTEETEEALEKGKENRTEKSGGEETTDAKDKMEAAFDEDEKQGKRKKKKRKGDVTEMSAGEICERESNGKKSKKDKDAANVEVESSFEAETSESKGNKRKKKKEAAPNLSVHDSEEKEERTIEGTKKKKKKKAVAHTDKKQDNGNSEREEDVVKGYRKKSIEMPAEEQPKVGETKKKKKKKIELVEEQEGNGEEKTKWDCEEPKTRESTGEFSGMFVETTLDSICSDPTESKKKKKKGKAKKKLVLEEDTYPSSLKSDEKMDGKMKEEEIELGEACRERKESVC